MTGGSKETCLTSWLAIALIFAGTWAEMLKS